MLKNVLTAISRLRESASHYNTSLYFQLSRARELHANSLFSLADILYWGLTDPGIAREDLSKYLSREARVRLRKFYNESGDEIQADNKIRFHEICDRHQLPTPRVFGCLRRQGETIGSADAWVLEELNLATLPAGEYIVKPATGNKGKGIFFFTKLASQYYAFGDEICPESDAKGRLLHAAQNDDILIQEKAVPLAEMADVSGTSGLQSVRLVSFLTDEGDVLIVLARFKFLVGSNRLDNFDNGQSGNLIAAIDPKSGRITACYRKELGEIGLRPIHQHPNTQRDLLVQVPGWDQIIALTERAARAFPTLRLLSWDVGLSEDGPQLLEANPNWEIFPIAPSDFSAVEPQWRKVLINRR